MMDAAHIYRFVRYFAAGDGCWEWRGGCTQGGYGVFSVHRRKRYAHRLAYELLVGPIPEGLQIDHLCRNRRCVNPSHMEPVTARENILRGTAPAARHARVTHCPKGHPYDEANTYRRASGKRECRRCNRERVAALYVPVAQRV